MANNLGKYKATITADTAKFKKELGGAQQSTSKLKESITSMSSVVTLVSGAAFASMVKSSLDAANTLGDLSTRLGTTVEGLSRLQYAAKLTGVSSNTLTTGLQRMTRRIAEAAGGSGEAVNALDELGLSAEKLKELRPEQQFEVLADALQKVPAQSDKVRLSMKLLDSEGVSLLQTMSGGAAAIREMGKESDAIGNTISTKFAEDATKANAAINKITGASVGLINSFVAGLGPTIEQVAVFLGEVTPQAGQLAADALVTLRRYVVEVASDISAFLEGVAGTASVVAEWLGADDISQSLFNTAQMYKKLSGDLGELATVYKETNTEIQTFNVELGNGVVKLEDYTGGTKSGTEANKEYAASLKEIRELESARSNTFTKFDSIRESLLTEEEAEKESHQRRLGQIAAFEAQYPGLKALAHQVAEDEQRRHEKAITDIKKAEKEKQKKLDDLEFKTKLDGTKSLFGNMSTLMNSGSRKLFEVGKVGAIANAVINTAEGVSKAWALGPILGPAAAAMVAAAGAVQIQTIKNQKFGGGATVNAGTSGGAPAGTFQPPQPSIPVGAQNAEGQGRNVEVHFHGDVGDISNAEKLAELISDYVETSDFVLVSDTSRNGQLLRTA